MASASLKRLIGAAGCVLLGVSGGFAVRAVANVEAPSQGEPERPPPDGQLRAAAVTGMVRVLARTGAWLPARKDDVVRRPTGFDVSRGASSITLTGPDVSLTAMNGARGLVNGLGSPLRVYLQDGLVVVQSPREQVTVVVDRDGSEITGRSFGVRVDDDRVLVSAIGREVEVSRRGQTNRFPEGSEAILSSLGFRQVPLPTELSVRIEGVSRSGNKWQVRGRTSGTAAVMVADGGRYSRVPVEPDGAFVTLVSDQQPRPGELIAQDSAGREAEVGRPSGALDASGSVRRRAAAGEPSGEPDPLFPDDAARAAPEPAAEREPEAAAPARSPAARPAGAGGGSGGKATARRGKSGKGAKAGGGDEGEGDAITLDDFAEPAADHAPDPAPKSVELPKTETPPAVAAPSSKPEKPAPKGKDEEGGEDELQINW